jgi:hypothetical protein
VIPSLLAIGTAGLRVNNKRQPIHLRVPDILAMYRREAKWAVGSGQWEEQEAGAGAGAAVTASLSRNEVQRGQRASNPCSCLLPPALFGAILLPYERAVLRTAAVASR